MTRIGFRLSGNTVKVARNKNSRIDYLRSEIAELRYQEKMGLISKEEADMKIELLQSQIDKLEFGVPEGSDVEEKEIVPESEFSPLDSQLNGSSSDSAGDAQDNNEYIYGKNDASDIQARYNRAVFDI